MSDNPFASLAEPAALPKPNELVAEYLRLRDAKKAAEDAIKAWTAQNFTSRMDEIETTLMAFLNDAGSDSLKTPDGTVFKRVETSVTVADQKEFSRFVIGSQAWDLIDFRANKTGIKAFLEENTSLPPGINHSATTVVSVRKPT